MVAVEAVKDGLLERHAAEEARQKAVGDLAADQIVLAAVVRLPEIVPVDGTDGEEVAMLLGLLHGLGGCRRSHLCSGRRLSHDDLGPPVAGLTDLGFGDGFIIAVRDLLSAIALNEPAAPDFLDGLRTQEAVAAAQVSAKVLSCRRSSAVLDAHGQG